ncbi:FG-GAP-like repeat-containing protein [Streptomyces sp. NPDC050504]|uniref:FG-GAP repeat domain-containing protein n=1 Tax=Streptomyces sp. NPDC050504 TaxID=3365618 RepID=UPI0037A117A7
MNRHALLRAGVSTVLAVAFAAGLGPTGGPAALAAPGETAAPGTGPSAAPAEVVVPETLRPSARAAELAYPGRSGPGDGAGALGVFHTEEGLAGRQWTRYADGRSFPVAAPGPGVKVEPTGSDVLAHVGNGRVELRDAATGTTRVVTLPEGARYAGTYGSTVVAHVTSADGARSVKHLLTPQADGTTRDATLNGLPEGATTGEPVTADSGAIVFIGRLDGTRRMFVVDAETGRFEGVTAPLTDDYRFAMLSPTYLVAYGLDNATLTVSPRADLSAKPSTVTMSAPGPSKPTHQLALVGDSLVRQIVHEWDTRLQVVPLDGGPRTLLPGRSAAGALAAAPGGTAVTVGGTSPADWGIRRIAPDATGRPVVTQIKRLPPVSARIDGLALSDGFLAVTDDSAPTGRRLDYVRPLAAAGTPVPGPREALWSLHMGPTDCAAADHECRSLRGAGGGGFVREDPLGDGTGRLWSGRGEYHDSLTTPEYGAVTSAAGHYALHAGAKTGAQTVYDTFRSVPVLQRPGTAASLWDGKLWAPGTGAGSVTALDLATKRVTETVATGSGCVPAELQTVGRWIYWNCADGGPAGVYDRTAKKSVPVPPGEALLGDGFVVTHDKGAGKLVLTGVATGSAESRTIGDLPDTGAPQRHVRWSVDRFGGHVAYADAQERVHVVPSGVPAQPLTLTDESPAVSANLVVPVDAVLSKPAARWTLAFKDAITGRAVRTLTGGETRGRLTPVWDAKDAKGNQAVKGSYDWTLTVLPADGQGAPLVRGGRLKVAGTAPWRDFSGPNDGVGDLLTLDGPGGAAGTRELKVHRGNGRGGIVVDSSYLASTYEAVVPFSDLNGDTCNDALLRRPGGKLTSLTLNCHGGFVFNGSEERQLGTGWNQYDVLMSPGDLTGDGRADLVARQRTTGDLYLFANNAAGGLKARGKIGAKWTGYRAVFGAGDVTGDGVADVYAVDRADNLWRYAGAASGSLKPRVLVAGGGWAKGRNAFVGAGDLNKDGVPDLVSRNAAGHLLRNYVTGAGALRPTVRIGAGWQKYRSVS